MSNDLPVASGTVSDFVGSIGVNTHHGALVSGIYSSAQSIIGALSYIGVSNVRSSFSTDTRDIAFNQALTDSGAKFNFLVPSTLAQSGVTGLKSFVSGLESFVTTNPKSVNSIEGLNEVDIQYFSFNGDSSLAGAAAFQKALYSSLQASTKLADVPVANLTVAFNNEANYNGVSGTTGAFDLANLHAYNTTQKGILTTLKAAVGLANSLGSDGQFIISESGYTTDSTFTRLGVTEAVQAKLILETVLDSYAVGADKTYLYELFDNNQDANMAQKDKSWGLFEADGTPKLAAVSLHNLMAVLTSKGGQAMAGSYQVQGLGADGHSLSLTKGSGATDLVLWRDVVAWNDATDTPTTTPPEQVTVNFSSVQAHVYVYSPLDGLNPIASYTNVSSITLPLSDSPLIVELGVAQPLQESASQAPAGSTLATDAADLIANVYTYARQSTLTTINLSGDHTLKMTSVSGMKEMIANFSGLFGKIAGGYDFSIQTSSGNSKIETLYDSTGSAFSKTTRTYDASGALKTTAITNLVDNSSELYHYGVTGQSYTSDHYVYTATGATQSITRYHADGTLDYYTQYNSDGSRVIDNYNTAGKKTIETIVAVDGGRTTLNYDSTGHVTQKQAISTGGATTTWIYDTSGATRSVTTVNADKTSTYDRYGVIGQSYVSDHTVFKADGSTESITRYHADGTLDYYTKYNADGSRLVDTYNAAGKKTLEVITAAGGASTTTLTFDTAGHTVQKQTVASGTTTTWAYDSAGVTKTMTVANADKSGEYNRYGVTGQSFTTEKTVYKAGGAVESITRTHADGSLDYYTKYNADNSRITRNYDATGHKTLETELTSAGTTNTTMYDVAGKIAQQRSVSARGLDTTWIFDTATGAVKTKTILYIEKNSQVEHFGIKGQSYTSDRINYAADGTVTGINRFHADGSLDYSSKTNANGSRVATNYDTAGRKMTETTVTADGSSTTLTFDTAGKTTQKQAIAGGTTTLWTLDAASGATKTMTVTNADKSGEYNRFGVTGQSFTSEKTVYKAGGAVDSITRKHADGSLDYYTKYNADGSRTIDTFDAAGRKTVETITTASGAVTTLNYDTAGKVLQKQAVGGGTTSVWTYDPASGATKTMTVTNADKSGEYNRYGVTGQSYTSDHTVYKAGGAIDSITRYHADGSRDYYTKYNADGSRLVDNFDAAGNKTLEVITTANGSTTTLTFDTAGHTLQKQAIAGGTTTLWTYDLAGATKTMTVTNADKSGEYNRYGVTGQTYTTEQTVFKAGGAVDSITRTHADGSPDYYTKYSADGSRLIDYFDAFGKKTLEVLSGTTKADTFVIGAGTTSILDFKASEGDKINLAKVDAITSNAAGTLDHFTFGGSAFTGVAGQLIVTKDPANLDGKHWLVQGDTDGDRRADLMIQVTTPDAHQPTSSDFLFGWS